MASIKKELRTWLTLHKGKYSSAKEWGTALIVFINHLIDRERNEESLRIYRRLQELSDVDKKFTISEIFSHLNKIN